MTNEDVLRALLRETSVENRKGTSEMAKNKAKVVDGWLVIDGPGESWRRMAVRRIEAYEYERIRGTLSIQCFGRFYVVEDPELAQSAWLQLELYREECGRRGWRRRCDAVLALLRKVGEGSPCLGMVRTTSRGSYEPTGRSS